MILLIFCLLQTILSIQDQAIFKGKCVFNINGEVYDLSTLEMPIIRHEGLGKITTFYLDVCAETAYPCKSTLNPIVVFASAYVLENEECYPLTEAGQFTSIDVIDGNFIYHYPKIVNKYYLNNVRFSCNPIAEDDSFYRINVGLIDNRLSVSAESQMFCDRQHLGSLGRSVISSISWFMFLIGNLIFFTGLTKFSYSSIYLLTAGFLMVYAGFVYLVAKHFLFSFWNDVTLIFISVAGPVIVFRSTNKTCFRLLGFCAGFGFIYEIIYLMCPFIRIYREAIICCLIVGSLFGAYLGPKMDHRTVIFSTLVIGTFWVAIGSNAFMNKPIPVILDFSMLGDISKAQEYIDFQFAKLAIIITLDCLASLFIQLVELKQTYQEQIEFTRESKTSSL